MTFADSDVPVAETSDDNEPRDSSSNPPPPASCASREFPSAVGQAAPSSLHIHIHEGVLTAALDNARHPPHPHMCNVQRSYSGSSAIPAQWVGAGSSVPPPSWPGLPASPSTSSLAAAAELAAAPTTAKSVAWAARASLDEGRQPLAPAMPWGAPIMMAHPPQPPPRRRRRWLRLLTAVAGTVAAAGLGAGAAVVVLSPRLHVLQDLGAEVGVAGKLRGSCRWVFCWAGFSPAALRP